MEKNESQWNNRHLNYRSCNLSSPKTLSKFK